LDEVVVVRLERSRLPEVVADHTLAAVGQEGPHARAGPDAVIVDAEAGIELTTVQHAGRVSLASHPVKPYPAGRALVQGELDAVAEPAAPLVNPLDVAGLDAVEVLEERPPPQRRSHVVIRHRDPLASQVGQRPDARPGVALDLEPEVSPAQVHRNPDPAPPALAPALASVARDQRLRQGHLGDLEIVVVEI